MRSLIQHAKAGNDLREDLPAKRDFENILQVMEEWFAPARWSIPTDFLEYSHYKRVVMSLDWTSSPGYPYMRNATTNGNLFSVVDGVPCEDKLLYYWAFVQTKIQENFPDKIRLFIKPEPLKESKIRNKQYRLISSVSIIDQIIDHMLFADINQKLISHHAELPTMVGWSQYNGGYRLIPRTPWIAIDKTKWDWTVKTWMLEIELELRIRLCNNMTPRWLELASWRYKSLFEHPEFICSNGYTFRQRKEGVMKSGCVNTITTNSIIQVILHVRACLETNQDIYPILVMGDDTLQHPLDDLKSYLDKLGEFCLVKHHKHANEFAGMEFHRNGNVEPLYKGKHAFTLLHMDPKYIQEVASSYSLLYQRSNRKQFMRQLFNDMGITIPTENRINQIWESDD